MEVHSIPQLNKDAAAEVDFLKGLTASLHLPLACISRFFFAKFGPFLPEKKIAKFEALLPRIGASEARHGTRGADNFAVGKKNRVISKCLVLSNASGAGTIPESRNGISYCQKAACLFLTQG